MSENKKVLIVGAIAIAIILSLSFILITNKNKSMKELQRLKDYVETSEPKFLYFGTDNCPYCVAFKLELGFLYDQYDFDYLYVDTDKLSDKDLAEALDILEIDPEGFGTPYLAVVKNREMIDGVAKCLPDDELFEFLQKNEVIDKSEKLVLNYIDFSQYKSLINSKTNKLIMLGQMNQQASKEASMTLVNISREYDTQFNYLNLSKLTEEEGSEFGDSLEIFKNIQNLATPLLLIVKEGKVVDSLLGEITEEAYFEFLSNNNIIKE